MFYWASKTTVNALQGPVCWIYWHVVTEHNQVDIPCLLYGGCELYHGPLCRQCLVLPSLGHSGNMAVQRADSDEEDPPGLDIKGSYQLHKHINLSLR